MTATILIVARQPDTPSDRAARPGDTGQHGGRPISVSCVHIVRCQRQDYSHHAALTAKPGVHRKGKTGGFPCVPVQSLKQYDSRCVQHVAKGPSTFPSTNHPVRLPADDPEFRTFQSVAAHRSFDGRPGRLPPPCVERHPGIVVAWPQPWRGGQVTPDTEQGIAPLNDQNDKMRPVGPSQES